jgi:V/A-type H+-transporting ATPase subunit A
MKFADKNQARSFFQKLTQTCRDWNNSEFQSDEFKQIEEQMTKALAEVSDYAE